MPATICSDQARISWCSMSALPSPPMTRCRWARGGPGCSSGPAATSRSRPRCACATSRGRWWSRDPIRSGAGLREEHRSGTMCCCAIASWAFRRICKVVGVLEDGQDERHAPAHVLLSDGGPLQVEHVVGGELQLRFVCIASMNTCGNALDDVRFPIMMSFLNAMGMSKK
jgi:hypothetical protein